MTEDTLPEAHKNRNVISNLLKPREKDKDGCYICCPARIVPGNVNLDKLMNKPIGRVCM